MVVGMFSGAIAMGVVSQAATAIQTPVFAMFIQEEALQAVQFSLLGLAGQRKYALIEKTLEKHLIMIRSLEITTDMLTDYYTTIKLDFLIPILIQPYREFAEAQRIYNANLSAIVAENLEGFNPAYFGEVNSLKRDRDTQISLLSIHHNADISIIKKMYRDEEFSFQEYADWRVRLDIRKKDGKIEQFAKYHRRKAELDKKHFVVQYHVYKQGPIVPSSDVATMAAGFGTGGLLINLKRWMERDTTTEPGTTDIFDVPGTIPKPLLLPTGQTINEMLFAPGNSISKNLTNFIFDNYNIQLAAQQAAPQPATSPSSFMGNVTATPVSGGISVSSIKASAAAFVSNAIGKFINLGD